MGHLTCNFGPARSLRGKDARTGQCREGAPFPRQAWDDVLEAAYATIQKRIDAMYLDKLDGRISAIFFDQKSAEWRGEQDRIWRAIEEHQAANKSYVEAGVQLIDLAGRAHELFRRQQAREKRGLLNFVASNCTWKGGKARLVFANHLICCQLQRGPTVRLRLADVAREAFLKTGSSARTRTWNPSVNSCGRGICNRLLCFTVRGYSYGLRRGLGPA
jgi:hypothetical protein